MSHAGIGTGLDWGRTKDLLRDSCAQERGSSSPSPLAVPVHRSKESLMVPSDEKWLRESGAGQNFIKGRDDAH
jgi:hypothetical protein